MSESKPEALPLAAFAVQLRARFGAAIDCQCDGTWLKVTFTDWADATVTIGLSETDVSGYRICYPELSKTRRGDVVRTEKSAPYVLDAGATWIIKKIIKSGAAPTEAVEQGW